LAVVDPARYSVIEALRDGRRMEIRALTPDDRTALLAAVDRTSTESLYRRFFSARRRFTERETAYFLNIDFKNHVALVAVVYEGGRQTIIAGGRYIMVEPGKAELAFAVVDDYQGQGVGSALLRHLAAIARAGHVQEFTAEVLAENTPMLRVFERSGLRVRTKIESGVIHVEAHLGPFPSGP
jgi:RimJ/RimL family protein N-acetyltransferase